MYFSKTEIKYLGYIVTRDGIKPQLKKVETILNIKVHSSIKQLKSLLGMVQYYRDMWPKRSNILAPLTEASSSKNKKPSNGQMLWRMHSVK